MNPNFPSVNFTLDGSVGLLFSKYYSFPKSITQITREFLAAAPRCLNVFVVSHLSFSKLILVPFLLVYKKLLVALPLNRSSYTAKDNFIVLTVSFRAVIFGLKCLKSIV